MNSRGLRPQRRSYTLIDQGAGGVAVRGGERW
jgi:hypothetical protein